MKCRVEQDLNRYLDEQDKLEAQAEYETAQFVESVLEQTHRDSGAIIFNSFKESSDKAEELLCQLMEYFYEDMPPARALRLRQVEAIADIAINIMRTVREDLEEFEQ